MIEAKIPFRIKHLPTNKNKIQEKMNRKLQQQREKKSKEKSKAKKCPYVKVGIYTVGEHVHTCTCVFLSVIQWFLDRGDITPLPWGYLAMFRGRHWLSYVRGAATNI